MAGHDDKTEKPTDKRLSEAHSRGQFARAPELQVVAGLIAAFLVLNSVAKDQAVRIAEFTVSLFGHLETVEVTAESIPAWSKASVLMMLALGLPMMAGCALAGVLAGGLQSRFLLTPKVLEIKFDKLNPVNGFGRIFSKEVWVRLIVDLLKFGIVGFLVWGGVKQILADPIFYTPVPLARLGGFIFETSLSMLLRLSLSLGVLAGGNYLYQRFKVGHELMMTKQEIKEEAKEANGDPFVKAMQRQMGRRYAQKQMLAAVPTADVVVTNPTHFAVALKYERGKDSAPVILAKGENMFAKRIKVLARKHGVPTVENKPVARALYKFGKVGDAIPSQLYHAVAEILAFVYRTHRYYFHELKARRLNSNP